MWVFTTIGFFSVVGHRTVPGYVLVRARAIADLRELVKRLPLPHPKIRRTPTADYLFRVVARQDQVAELLAQLAREIDYDNFKTAVERRQGPGRAALYHDVWGAMLPLQTNPEKGGRQWPPE
jgi:hypothetical protein